MAVKWQRPETEYFIKILQDYPVLYSCNKNDHTTVCLKKRALDELKSKMLEVKPEITVAMIRQKIKTLRCQVNTEKKNSENYNGNYTPKLWCYSQCLYLLKYDDETNEENVSADECTNEPFLVYEIDSPPPAAKSCEHANVDNQQGQKRSWDEAFNAEETTQDIKPFAQEQQQPEQQKPEQQPPKLTVRNFQKHSKAALFCEYLCSELEELDETSDEVKLEIVRIVMEAKAKERGRKQAQRMIFDKFKD